MHTCICICAYAHIVFGRGLFSLLFVAFGARGPSAMPWNVCLGEDSDEDDGMQPLVPESDPEDEGAPAAKWLVNLGDEIDSEDEAHEEEEEAAKPPEPDSHLFVGGSLGVFVYV